MQEAWLSTATGTVGNVITTVMQPLTKTIVYGCMKSIRFYSIIPNPWQSAILNKA